MSAGSTSDSLNQLIQTREMTRQFSNAPKLEVLNLSKTFKAKNRQPLLVLEDINLMLYPKEFACLVGASGCGKSTLLNIIAGLLSPSSGAIRVDGQVVKGPGSDRGMVFQSYTLYPWLTVAQNIAFGLELRKMPKFEQQDRVNYYLNVVGLTRFANAYPKELSGRGSSEGNTMGAIR